MVGLGHEMDGKKTSQHEVFFARILSKLIAFDETKLTQPRIETKRIKENIMARSGSKMFKRKVSKDT